MHYIKEKKNLDTKYPVCESKSFPVFGLSYNKDGVFCYNGTPVQIKHLYRDLDTSQIGIPGSIDYLPMQRPTSRYEGLIFMPEYSKKEFKAFVTIKDNYGYNVNVAMLNTKTNTIYLWRSLNFDLPTGVAIRTTKTEAEIYTVNEEEGENENVWIPLSIDKMFEELTCFIEYSKNHPEFTSFKNIVLTSNTFTEQESACKDIYDTETKEILLFCKSFLES